MVSIPFNDKNYTLGLEMLGELVVIDIINSYITSISMGRDDRTPVEIAISTDTCAQYESMFQSISPFLSTLFDDVLMLCHDYQIYNLQVITATKEHLYLKRMTF